jgi:hypothetical protein
VSDENHERGEWIKDAPDLKVWQRDRVPSWARYGAGNAYTQFILFGDRLSIDATERGPRSGKRVMIEYNADSTRALYELLREHFGKVQP